MLRVQKREAGTMTHEQLENEVERLKIKLEALEEMVAEGHKVEEARNGKYENLPTKKVQ